LLLLVMLVPTDCLVTIYRCCLMFVVLGMLVVLSNLLRR
jgi:hypothetical protein